jgi:hypothetical protein
MEYIASGNPIFCLGDPDGDAAFLLKDVNQSEVFARSDIESMTKFLNLVFENWMAGKNDGNQKADLRYSRYETARELSEIIKSMI